MVKQIGKCIHCGAIRYINSQGYCKRCNSPQKRAEFNKILGGNNG